MPKYRVTFEKTIQVDGWTDFRDTEYETIRERVTVEAKNLRGARIAAVRRVQGAFNFNHWWASNIKKITRVKKK